MISYSAYIHVRSDHNDSLSLTNASYTLASPDMHTSHTSVHIYNNYSFSLYNLIWDLSSLSEINE